MVPRISGPLTASIVTAIPTTAVGHGLSTKTHPQAHLFSWDLRRFRSSPVGGKPRSRPGPQTGIPAYSHQFPPAEGKASTNRNSNPLEMAVSLHHTHMLTLPRLVRTGTRTDTDASLLWDKMALSGRIQHSHPTRSYMDSKPRSPALTAQAQQPQLQPSHRKPYNTPASRILRPTRSHQVRVRHLTSLPQTFPIVRPPNRCLTGPMPSITPSVCWYQYWAKTRNLGIALYVIVPLSSGGRPVNKLLTWGRPGITMERQWLPTTGTFSYAW